MTNTPHYDALVIGGGVNGLTAAAYLAKAGRRTLLLEARDTLGGLCKTTDLGNGYSAPLVAHALYALDPHVTVELKLTRRGLKFALRDAPMTLLREGMSGLSLSRDTRTSARNISVHSGADADAWPRYCRELFAFARAMRPLWWDEGKAADSDLIERFARTGYGAWLDSWFESDALKSLLAFDASAMAPDESGSALLLAWRAAQEMCGLQAAVAFPVGGPGALVDALSAACKAAGAEIRKRAIVDELTASDGHVTGARLRSGEIVTAPLVLSSLSRRQTLLGLANGAGLGIAERRRMETALPPVASAKIVLALDRLPETGISMNGRLVLAERMESYFVNHALSRASRMPTEPVMEVTFPTISDPSLAPARGHVASVLVRPVPREVPGGWDAQKVAFAASIVGKLNNQLPGLARHVVAAKVLAPNDLAAHGDAESDALSASRMLGGWAARAATPVDGLFLCGADADPVPAVSGRAARIAATLALKSAGSP